MKTNQVIQLNRGRCIYQAYKKQDIIEDDEEMGLLNRPLEMNQIKTIVPETEEENISNKKADN